MALPIVELDIKSLAKKTTLHIRLKRLRQWEWRIKIAEWLMRLAAWVMWVNVEVEFENGPSDS